MKVAALSRLGGASPRADQAAATDRRGGGRYFAATLVSQGAALFRYVVLARLLGPEQLGLAATLVVTSSFFDMISDTGADRFLIQNRDGDEPAVQRLVQLVLVVRGFVSAGLMVLFAVPIAYFYNTPGLAKGLMVLALSPFINGFLHLDVRRAQRGHDFRPQANCMITGETAGLAATVLAAWLTHSFTAILYGLITRALVIVLMSHRQGERPYRLAWDRQHAPALARFALPLMLNGFVLFIVSQGDRVIVGNQLGVKALGYYSAVMLLIFYPSVVLGSYLNAIYVPLIAAQRDSDVNRNRVSDGFRGRTLLLALAMVVGFAVVAPALVPLLFGGRFSQSALLVALIGVLQIARFMLGCPTAVALALGRSTTVLASNLAHIFAFAGAIIGLRLLGGLLGVVVGFAVGELIANIIAQLMTNRDMARSPFHQFDRLAMFALTSAVVVGWNLAIDHKSWVAMVAMALLSAAVFVWVCVKEHALIVELAATARALASRLFFRPTRW
jgi:O-antigen/teichoic acid export membrane protein